MKIQDTNVICPPVISQYAALGALQVGVDYCHRHLQAIARVRQQVLSQFAQLNGLIEIPSAEGAFYFLLRVHTKLASMQLVERLIQKHQVAVIPGSTFGMDQGCYLRVAYGALQEKTTNEGIQRLIQGLETVLK